MVNTLPVPHFTKGQRTKVNSPQKVIETWALTFGPAQAREVNNPTQTMLLEVPKNVNSLYTRKSMPPTSSWIFS
jgi:hypothetical protein